MSELLKNYKELCNRANKMSYLLGFISMQLHLLIELDENENAKNNRLKALHKKLFDEIDELFYDLFYKENKNV